MARLARQGIERVGREDHQFAPLERRRRRREGVLVVCGSREAENECGQAV
jgi:hypothetical protein